MRLDETITAKPEHNSQVNRQPNKSQARSQNNGAKNTKPNQQRSTKPQPKTNDNAAMGNAFADAFAKLKK